jgi:hypothetical protein
MLRVLEAMEVTYLLMKKGGPVHARSVGPKRCGAD